MQKFNAVYVISAAAAALPLIAAVILRIVYKTSMGKFAKGFAAGFMTYGGIIIIAAILLRMSLGILLASVIVPMIAVILLVIPLCALLLAFAAVMIYYHALFKKIRSATDALALALGLFSISFLARIASEYYKIKIMNIILETSESNYRIFMPNMILGMIASVIVRVGIFTGAAAVVCGTYSSEKMTKRSAAKISSAVMGILTVGFDMLLIV